MVAASDAIAPTSVSGVIQKPSQDIGVEHVLLPNSHRLGTIKKPRFWLSSTIVAGSGSGGFCGTTLSTIENNLVPLEGSSVRKPKPPGVVNLREGLRHSRGFTKI